MTELIPLAATVKFTLYERASCARNGWRSLKLVRGPRKAGEKNNWWFGWNGERLSHNTDSKRLAGYHPKIFRWVINSLVANVIDEAVRAHRSSER